MKNKDREAFVNYSLMSGQIGYVDIHGMEFQLLDNSGKYVPASRRAETYAVHITVKSSELHTDEEGDSYYPVSYMLIGVVDKKSDDECLRDLHERIIKELTLVGV